MPVYLILVIAVVVGVDRGRKQIERVEGAGGVPSVPRTRSERWHQADAVERTAFVVMAASALFWMLLVLPVGFAVAVIALAVAVWKRPYLETTLAPVAIAGGALIALYDVVLSLLHGDDGGWGAILVNSAVFGGLWIVIGLLLRAAGARARTESRSGPLSSNPTR